MLILGIETTGPFCSVSLCRDERLVTGEVGSDRLNHLSQLIPMMDRVLRAGKTGLGDLDAIALSMGPGSFTGIRIGVSTARAICQVRKIPIIPCSTLESIALAHEDKARFICPIMDARQNQTYSAVYDRGENLIPDGAYSIEEILGQTGQRLADLAVDGPKSSLLFVGDGVDRYGHALGQFAEDMKARVDCSMENIPQKADHLCRLAGRLLAKHGQKAMTLDYNSLLPNYMRKSAPERKLEERLKNE